VQKISALLHRFPRWSAIGAGALSAYGFAPWGLWPLTLACFALLIHLIAHAQNTKRAFAIGWLFGVGHFTFGNQWIAVAFTFQAAMPIWLGYIAVVGLALYLAVYPALAASGAYGLRRFSAKIVGQFRADESDVAEASLQTLPLILAFAGLWILTEWLRSWVFTGYVWNPLAVGFVSHWFDLWLPTIGTYGVGGLMILASGAMALLGSRHWKSGFALAAIVGVAIVSSAKIYVTEPSLSARTAVTVVQPNISQADKYAPGYDALNFAKLAMHSRPLPAQAPRLILWPEAAIPDYLEDGYPYRYYYGQPGESAAGARARLTTLMADEDVLVTGANRLIFEKGALVAARNSVAMMDAYGRILGHYDKAHLVPYGEYLPLPWLLKPLGLARLVPGSLDFWPGPGARTMTVTVDGKPVKIGMQICYEMIFSGQTVDRKNRPDFIFNPSNDAWFGTIGPPQHLAQARLRAIEEGLPVIRSTPTGISAIIDADGRILQSLPLGTDGRIDAFLPRAKAPTLFAQFGNIIPLALAGLLVLLTLLPLAHRRG
jgi:apolipoprotein N-acyltransferase